MKTPTKRETRRLAASLAIVTALATGSAWAADWTVSEDTTLAEDVTVDALTVESGVTLDLNGYKLTCASLDGSGTITSSGEDLTTPSGICTNAAPSGSLYRGTTANLFNNNFTYREDTTSRILLNNKNANLPLMIDYDFGQGNAYAVTSYKIWAGVKTRAPKAWVLYGSNTDSAYGNASTTGWITIDERSNETGWSGTTKNNPADPRSYSCSNDTAYRYYRLEVKDNNGDSSYLEIVQLEYFKSGELHLNVASGSAAWPTSITFAGNIKVVKEGSGSLVSSGDLNMDGATFVIAAGTVQSANTFRLAQATSDKAVNVEVAEGGTLHSGGILAIGCGKNATLTVNGGIVYSASYLRVGNHSSSTATLNLNGGMVRVSSVVRTNGSGTLNFNSGTLQATADNNSNFISGTLTAGNVLSGGGTIDANGHSVKIAKELSGEGAMTFKGGGTITLDAANDYMGGTTIELGTKVATSNETAKNAILSGLTIDGVSYFATADDVEVFQYTSALTDPDDLASVNLVNCGEGSTKKISDTRILVDFIAPSWATIGTDTTWSDLVAEIGEPPAGMTVIIDMTAACTLAIDTDVTVAGLAFSGEGAASSTLSIAAGATVSADSIGEIGSILNNGTIVKTGDGTATLQFDNDSTGVTTISSGTLKVMKDAPNSGTAQTIRVKSGATFDVNGYSVLANVVLEAGAKFVNSRGDLGYRRHQTVSLTLEGDATATASYEFGLMAQGDAATSLNLGANTLTLDGNSTFRLSNTTINGAGTIAVTGGTLTIKGGHTVTGNDCTLTIGSGAALALGYSLVVSNFTNGGTISNNSTLTVTGTLTPGNAIPRLTLSSGATVKATGTAQLVSTAFSASGTATIDASAITVQQLNAAEGKCIPVLTVPTADKGGNWAVSNPPVPSVRAKWVDSEDGTTSTLYLYKSPGTTIVFQ